MTRPLDYFYAPRDASFGECPCCGLDLDADAHHDRPLVSLGDGTHWCEPCADGVCEHDDAPEAIWPRIQPFVLAGLGFFVSALAVAATDFVTGAVCAALTIVIVVAR